ncbi:MAG: hypothetical protein ACON4Q_07335, partial [Candidatus Puniceispirillaceae bacterium]
MAEAAASKSYATNAETNPPIGYEAFCAEFAQRARAGRVHHGWVLAGPSGIGKSKLARWLAAWLIAGRAETEGDVGSGGLFGPDETADQSADAQIGGNEMFADLEANLDAHQVLQGVHPDFLMIEAEISEKNKSGQIKIEQIRKMGSFAAQTSGRGGWRVMIIDSMEAVNRNGANAMLKILEEPPEKTVIFLLSSQPENLLPTIRSRISLARLPVLSPQQVMAISHNLRPDIEADELAILTQLSYGSPGRLLALVDSGVVPLYLESCALFAQPKPAANQALMLASQWGPGGMKGAPVRQLALYLFDQLLSAAACRALGHAINDQKPEVVIAAEQALVQRHEANKLAELHA